MSQQIINIGSAPNDGTGDQLRMSFDKCNLNFTELYDGLTASLPIGNAIQYQFSNSTSEPPGAQEIRLNNATQSAATLLWASHTTSSGINIKQFLSAATIGAKLILQDKNDNTNYVKFDVTGSPVDKTTYWEFSVSVTASGGSLPNAAILASVTAAAAGGGGNVSNVGTPTNGQLAQWTGATTIQGINASSLGFAPLASPTFTGDPQAPTPAIADNDTSIATTAFVKAQGYGNVLNSGTPANGQWAQWTDATHIQGIATASTPWIQKTGDTMTGEFIISAANATMELRKSASGQINAMTGLTGTLGRWTMYLGDFNSESGSNAGSDFRILRIGDAGAGIDFPFYIHRQSGQLSLGPVINATRLSVGTAQIHMKCDGSSNVGLGIQSTLGGGSVYPMYFLNSAGTNVGNITITDTATSFVTTSDVNLKSNIRSYTEGREMLDKIEVIQFNWKQDGSGGVGVSAQQAQPTYPQAVVEGKGNYGEEDWQPWSVDYSKYVPLLIQALQQSFKEIDALKAQVSAFEGRN
jgi:Chaperone of endosialidase